MMFLSSISSLGKLIKLCDDVSLSEDNANCASLSQENVTEVVELVDKAVQVSSLCAISAFQIVKKCMFILFFVEFSANSQ